jgi:ribosomal protein L11 methyltransferase
VRWLELTVEADAEAVEAVSEVFGRVAAGTAVRPTRLIRDPADELAARGDPTAPYEVTAHIPDDPDAGAAVEATERALWHLQAFGLRPVSELRVRAVDDGDWLERWKEGYAAQRIGRVVIVPSWLDEPIGPDEVAIRLDPGMAFGTGLHPTTRACLELLQRIGPMPARVLDVGSGSGILALAALRLGAGRVDALDTDEIAVAATAANAEANGLGERVSARRGSLPLAPAATYRLVLANLVAAVLVELAPRLAVHLAPGGSLVASGIIAERKGEVEEALLAAGLRVAERAGDGDWVSLLVTRP